MAGGAPERPITPRAATEVAGSGFFHARSIHALRVQCVGGRAVSPKVVLSLPRLLFGRSLIRDDALPSQIVCRLGDQYRRSRRRSSGRRSPFDEVFWRRRRSARTTGFTSCSSVRTTIVHPRTGLRWTLLGDAAIVGRIKPAPEPSSRTRRMQAPHQASVRHRGVSPVRLHAGSGICGTRHARVDMVGRK